MKMKYHAIMLGTGKRLQSTKLNYLNLIIQRKMYETIKSNEYVEYQPECNTVTIQMNVSHPRMR
jgi:hypothetical protein